MYPSPRTLQPLLDGSTASSGAGGDAVVRMSTVPASAVEIVFQHMAYRKLLRHLRGTRENERPWTILWIFLTLLLVCGVLVPNIQDTGKIDVKLNLRSVGFWSLVAVICVFILVYTLTRVVVVVRWSLYWLLATEVALYLWKREFNLFSEDTPILLLVFFGLSEALTFAIYIMVNFGYPSLITSQWFRESGMLLWWYDIKPHPTAFWTYTYGGGIFEQQRGRRTFTYRGETENDRLSNHYGLPSGYGQWVDDAYNGEILSGIWEKGIPVGPFKSREFGSGFAFHNVRIGYVHCSDDDFSGRMFFPQQTKPPKIGVASVESSISGMFFSHLPHALDFYGPFWLGSEDDPGFERILEQTKQLYNVHSNSSVTISILEGRGVHVTGHTFNGNKPVQQLVIDVVDGNKEVPNSSGSNGVISASVGQNHQQEQQPQQNRLTTQNFRFSLALPAEQDEEDGEDTDDEFASVSNHDESDSLVADFGKDSTPPYIIHPSISTVNDQIGNNTPPILQHLGSAWDNLYRPFSSLPTGQGTHENVPHLRVRDWQSAHPEVLVFIPGFNASLEHSVNRLGQFVSLARLPPHIKPILFSWPCGRELTYLYACESARSDQTHNALFCLLKGLRDAGIRDIHFLIHSLGVLVAMSAFADSLSTGERSEISKLFQEVGPDGHHDFLQNNGNSDDKLLRARTFTLLHPDYPLNEFNNVGFVTIRRICDHITVIGDRKDFALDSSELGNGMMDTWRAFAYSKFPLFWKPHGEIEGSNLDVSSTVLGAETTIHPDEGTLRPKTTIPYFRRCCGGKFRDCCRLRKHGEDVLFGRKLTVGKNIYSLYVLPHHPSTIPPTSTIYGAVSDIFSSAAAQQQHQFLSAARVPFLPPTYTYLHQPNQQGGVGSTNTSAAQTSRKRIWLDLDSIDTTWMESNVHAMRHNYFNINPVLVEDIHELLVSGKRARERSLLLHREGNIFSYCNAPPFIVNE